MSSLIKELDDTSFEQHLSETEGLTFVDFWAPWCGPCRFVGPTVEKLATRFGQQVRFVKVNVDEAPDTAAAYQIASIPTLAIFRNGEPVNGVIGAASEEYLARMIEQELAA